MSPKRGVTKITPLLFSSQKLGALMRKTPPNQNASKNKRMAAVKRDAFTLADIQPKTEAQRMMIDGYLSGQNVVAFGSAGTGKSFIACYLALKDIIEKEKDRIIIMRSAVPTRDQGFLPGTLEEKSAVYEIPYVAIVNDICQNGTAWEILTKKKTIEFMTTSYVRGITLDDAVIIVDEFQNMDPKELESVLTRVGENSQIILCGDTRQSDLLRKREESCFNWMMEVSTRMPSWFDVVRFLPRDIVRSGFVRELIETIEEMD
jgi:phosphate starvation-inducible protein PhoH